MIKYTYWFVCTILNNLRSHCFVSPLVGYFTSFSRSKFYYKSNIIIIIFVFVVSIKLHIIQKWFQCFESKIKRKKRWVHAYWLVCKSLKRLWYNCFVCLLVGYFTFFSRSKFYYRSNSMLISFVLVLSIEWNMTEYRIFYGTRVLHD